MWRGSRKKAIYEPFCNTFDSSTAIVAEDANENARRRHTAILFAGRRPLLPGDDADNLRIVVTFD
jgi:hypothetical protein